MCACTCMEAIPGTHLQRDLRDVCLFGHRTQEFLDLYDTLTNKRGDVDARMRRGGSARSGDNQKQIVSARPHGGVSKQNGKK